MTKLNKTEINAVEALFTKLSETGDALDRELAAVFGDDAGEVRGKLEKGVDDFYAMYAEDVTREDIREKLCQRMDGMTKTEKYTWLANVMVALTQVSGSMIEGESWARSVEEHTAVLKALNMGMITEESEEVEPGIEAMLDLISENVDACAVLYLGEAPYEKLFDDCLTEDPDTIKALAINTREGSLNMAAAMCILKERGELPSLGDTGMDPRDFGVMAASILEIDAAHKSGSWDKAKAVIERVCKAAVTLLITSPAILSEALALVIVGAITGFNLFWMLIAGAVLVLNVKIGVDQTGAYAEKIVKVGAKLLQVALNGVLMVAGRMREWIRLHAAPGAVRAWERCRDFTVNRILIPAATFLLKVKEEVLRAAGIAVDKVKALLARLKESVAHVKARVEESIHGTRVETTVEVEEEDETEDETVIREPALWEDDEEEEEEGHVILV